MRNGWWRGSNGAAEDAVEMVGELMATRINVYGGIEGLNKNGLFDPSFDPIVIRSWDCDVLFTKMVVVFACVLQHGRLILSERVSGGGSMLLKASCGCSFGFTDVPAWAWI